MPQSAFQKFQSTPSAWRETPTGYLDDARENHFNPLPPHGGRPIFSPAPSTPFVISIHSLRMEGDNCRDIVGIHTDIFQSTPSAWRETASFFIMLLTRRFQSTPSAWRETSSLPVQILHAKYFNPLPPHGGRREFQPRRWVGERFQSTPSAWRETRHCSRNSTSNRISIHSLRMEGDRNGPGCTHAESTFQSTPSAWRETAETFPWSSLRRISIHSLRMEGDKRR